MQKKKPTKQIILFTIAIILLLLLIFAENIIKLTNKNKIGLAENTPNEITLVEPNVPVISAGMIPVKWNGTNWIITTVEDKDWYDYKNGKPAYIMLNDGYYQSELLRDMTNKELAENSVGNDAIVVPNVPNNNPSILIWIPRFAYNENGDVKYIKDIESADENWTIPEIFAYRQAETMPDFLLTGIWFEIDVDTAYSTKIAQMNQEESIYGFIKNTIAVSSDQTTQNIIQNYIANITNGTTRASFPTDLTTNTNTLTITDPTNPNRIILKIINQNHQDPIKAKASYNKETELITVEVTYSQYGIEKILYEDTQELTITNNSNNKTIANSNGIKPEYGRRKIAIIDNKGNRKELEIGITSKVYVTLYTDGTLGFCSNNSKMEGKTVEEEYGDISNEDYSNFNRPPWYSKVAKITTAEFVDEISPISTAEWFALCEYLTNIKNIENLNTINVTNMFVMFSSCGRLTTLDVSNFDTRNVTNMGGMFEECTRLTSIDVSNFNTRNVTNMNGMFCRNRNLSSIDVSSFDTRNVTKMGSMFFGCTNLKELDLNSFNTSKVTNINYIFTDCNSLKQITFGENWNKEVTLPNPTQDGYTCFGWYSDIEFTNKVANPGANYTPNGPITIYAQMVQNIYATLYTDGTLGFASNTNLITGKTKQYGPWNISNQTSRQYAME